MRVLRFVVLALALVLQAAAQFQFQGGFEDMFGGGGGGGGGSQGGGRQPAPKEEIVKGFACTATDDIVDVPLQCPCPGHGMVKCKLDDWYVCMPFGSKCAEGKFHNVQAAADEEFDYDEEE